MKKIILLLVSAILVLAGCGVSSYEATTTYTTEATPAVEAHTDTEATYTTKQSGKYVVGQSPSEYVSGNEVEFTTGKSGKYTCGTDFPAGTYDIEPVEGSGNVFANDLNQIMAPGGGEYAVGSYDNYTFEEGEVLEVSGVSVKLVPQNEDTFVIEPGSYNIVAKKGSGNVFANDLNEIMQPGGGDYAVGNYDNYTFTDGEELEVSGVSIELYKNYEATPAVEAEEITETLTVNADDATEVCTSNNEEVECSTLKEYETLKADVDTQMSEAN